MLILSKSWLQPTEVQKVRAFAGEATACASVGPETGHPVSVTQTGLPCATATTWEYALANKLAALLISFPLAVS